MLPAKGPAAGGSLVLLTGMNLFPARHDHIVVRFDDSVVSGTLLPNGAVQCRTPLLQLGYSGVSISTNNGVDYSHSVPYEATTTVELASPLINVSKAGSTPPGQLKDGAQNFTFTPSHGPIVGGTRITVAVTLPFLPESYAASASG